MADPERPQVLLTWASCEIEVPDALADRHGIRELQDGATVLAAGRLSERWMIEDEHRGKRGVIVAALVHPGPPPDQSGELFIAGGRL